MACFAPLQAYRLLNRVTPANKSVIVFVNPESEAYEEIQLPCGQCIGCRVDKARDWALRCCHEAQTYSERGFESSFVTLTYNDWYLCGRRSLVKKEFQDFMKRLRQWAIRKADRKYVDTRIRYFQCGEYGTQCKTCGRSEKLCGEVGCGRFIPELGRPHFHACLFGVEFHDKTIYKVRKGYRLYRSEALSRLWSVRLKGGEKYDPKCYFEVAGKSFAKIGFVTIGDVNWNSAGYLARYVTKKINGKRADDHYRVVNRQTGEIEDCVPEYVTVSNSPGLGSDWFERYGVKDCYPKDRVSHNGRMFRVPKYYDKLLERSDEQMFARVMAERRRKCIETKDDRTPKKLKAARKRFVQRTKNLVRELENAFDDF